jgi:shikimate kinase
MPGSGKSTIGKAVARRLDRPFVDCDVAIERRVGCSIAAFFERQGEDAFRELEMETLASLVMGEPSVLATGGGMVLRERNRELLRARTRCVYLCATTDLLWERLRRDRKRPLLQVADPEMRLRAMAAEREPLYRDTAELVIETDGLSFHRLVDRVVQHLRPSGAQPA